MTQEEEFQRLDQMYEFCVDSMDADNNRPFVENAKAIKMALHALRPNDSRYVAVTREQVEKMRGEWRSIPSLLEYYCSRCGEEFEIHAYDKDKYRFCPYCMAPMTDEAVDILWKLLEALHENVHND